MFNRMDVPPTKRERSEALCQVNEAVHGADSLYENCLEEKNPQIIQVDQGLARVWQGFFPGSW